MLTRTATGMAGMLEQSWRGLAQMLDALPSSLPDADGAGAGADVGHGAGNASSSSGDCSNLIADPLLVRKFEEGGMENENESENDAHGGGSSCPYDYDRSFVDAGRAFVASVGEIRSRMERDSTMLYLCQVQMASKWREGE